MPKGLPDNWDSMSYDEMVEAGKAAHARILARRDQRWAWAYENRALIETIAKGGGDDGFLRELCKVVDLELKWRVVDGMRQLIEDIKSERHGDA